MKTIIVNEITDEAIREKLVKIDKSCAGKKVRYILQILIPIPGNDARGEIIKYKVI